MRAVIQRVTRGAVSVAGADVSSIGEGLVILVAVEVGDTAGESRALIDKVAGLRIFADPEGRMNRSVVDIGGEILVVSQFTLAADVRRGRRPSFSGAAPGAVAEPMVAAIADGFRELGIPTSTGAFGEMMQVSLVNDGPVTIIIDVADGRVV